MEAADTTYKFSNYAIVLAVLLSIVISMAFKWSYTQNPINFMGGDAKDYYSTLVSTFITHDLHKQTADEWYLLKTNTGTINVHPIGVSILLLPFFLIAWFIAFIFGAALDGYSFPFQASVALAALTYATVGLVYLKKLFAAHAISDKTGALLIILIYFGTNLFHYTLSEAGMSHVYSFSLISVFLFHSYSFVKGRYNRDLLLSALVLGLILLVRPNNILILLSIFMWFRSWNECNSFFKSLLSNKYFYFAMLIAASIVFLQGIVWFVQTDSFFQNTYKRDGFYWFHPQLLNMLFGFNAGFFIYTPLCFLLLFGMSAVFKENRFAFYSTAAFLLVLFYFFSSYWGYTYFDGLGIRVLIDYYAVFALLGAKLFDSLLNRELIYNSVLAGSFLLLAVNLVYTYQANRDILLRAGMNFNKWKYVFLRTDPKYQNCLGGANELVPYAKQLPRMALQADLKLDQAFNFSNSEFGPGLSFDSLGFDTNRISLKLNFGRRELYANSSNKALICVSVVDLASKKNKAYEQFKLNETPSHTCCEIAEYSYTTNLVGQFTKGDRLSVYVWNIDKQSFFLENLEVEVYNYNYQLN
ncbi:MAG: hypothetical protein PSX36_06000 [bacterium]|nr:hypothetical protein [bacterium]